MDYLEVLPAVPLNPQGEWGRIFGERGAKDLREVARYLKALPYGYPQGEGLREALEEGLGTCVHKHGLLASCALELGVPVHKVVGIYPMDGHLVPSIKETLENAGCDSVPAMHCFLTYGPYRVDLTEGNCNGKTGPIDRYYHVQRVEPWISHQEEAAIYQEFLANHWRQFLPETAQGDFQTCVNLLKSCGEVMKLSLACGIEKFA